MAEIAAGGIYFGEGPRWHDGRLWFSDFFANSVHALAPDGRHEVMLRIDGRPSGLGWLPDDRLLVVSTLSGRRTWADLSGRGVYPDGICLDADGAVWVADAARPHCVRVREGGEIADQIQFGQRCYACALGGGDRRTLYAMTAPTSDPVLAARAPLGRVERARVPVPGAGRP
jgi:sugar lactone lactonase YvrE